MQPAPPGLDLRAVISFCEQKRSFAGLSGSDIRGRYSQPLCQDKAKRLVVNAAPEAARVGFKNVRRWRTVHRDADAARIVNRDGKLGLHACERHGHTFLADEEWFARQLLDKTFKTFRLDDGAPMN